jgi:hypothetical protein
MIAELLAITAFRTETVDLPRLAELAPCPPVPRFAALVVHFTQS